MTAPTPAVIAEPLAPAIPDWERRVSAAYLRILGATQADAGRSVGRSRRTLQRWEDDVETWAAARQEACRRWLSVPIETGRRTILRAIQEGDARTARWLIERTMPELAPPPRRHEHTGPHGAAIAHAFTVRG